MNGFIKFSNPHQTKNVCLFPGMTEKQMMRMYRSTAGHLLGLSIFWVIKNNRWNRSTLNRVGGRFERWEEQG